MQTFTLTIELGNDAMQTANDVAQKLIEVAGQMQYQEPRVSGYNILDDNGNLIGHYGVMTVDDRAYSDRLVNALK